MAFSESDELIAYGSLTAVAMIWGLSWPAGRFLALEFGSKVLTAAFIRFTFVVPFLFIFAKLFTGTIKVEKKLHKSLILFGLLQISLYNFFYLTGLRFTSASDASLVIAINPLLTAIISSFLYADEKLTLRKVLGFLIAFAGEFLIFMFSPNSNVENRILGNVVIFLAALVWATYSSFSRPIYQKIPPLRFQAWASFYGWLALGIFALVEKPWTVSPSSTSWAILAYLGILSAALANTIFSFGIKKIGPSRTSIFVNMVPLFGITFSFFLLDEEFSYWYLVAFVLVVTGINLVTRSKPRPPDEMS